MGAFEKLDVWKRSASPCATLYQELKDSREWGFRDQITRSALSISSNISEGCECNSRKKYVQFLRIAKGSYGELRTQLYIGSEADLLSESLARKLIQETTEISLMLGAMIAKLSRS